MYDKGVVEHLKISSLYWTLLWFRRFYGCNSRLVMMFGGWSNGGRKSYFFRIDHRCKSLKSRMICGNGGRWSKKLRLACACARGNVDTEKRCERNRKKINKKKKK